MNFDILLPTCKFIDVDENNACLRNHCYFNHKHKNKYHTPSPVKALIYNIFLIHQFQLSNRNIMLHIESLWCCIHKHLPVLFIPFCQFFRWHRRPNTSACAHSSMPALSGKRNIYPYLLLSYKMEKLQILLRHPHRMHCISASAPFWINFENYLFTLDRKSVV